MNKNEIELDFVNLKLGIILEKAYFRFSVTCHVTLAKQKSSPMLQFINSDLGQRIEVHPNSIEEIIQLEDENIFYIILNRRPSLYCQDVNSKNYWRIDYLEFTN